MIRFVRMVLLAAAGAGCASTSTEVSVAERKLPDAFPQAATGPSFARTSWREWFGDAQLNGLIAEGLRHNQDLRIALQRVEVSRAYVAQATGALIPQVALSLGSNIQKFGLYTEEGAGNASTDITPGRRVPDPLADFAGALETSWEIDLWGRLRNLRASAIAQHLASVEGTNLVLTSLISDLASAYFELLALDHVGEVLRQSVARQEHAVEVVQLQKQAGRANELAVQQFQGQLAETRALEREVARETVEVENRINVLLGRYPQRVSRDRASLFAELPRKLSAGLPSELLANRPDIRAAELQVQASKLDLKAARAAFFPSLTLSARVGLKAFSPAYLVKLPQSLTYSVGGGLLTPLFNWRGLEYELEGAKANQIQAIYSYQRTMLVAFVEVVDALSRIQHLDEILALKQGQKAAMEQAISSADMLYRAGKAGYLEVLMAQQSALRAELDLIEAWKRRRIASVGLYRALGGGWR